MKQSFGQLATGEEAFLYTISCNKLTATVTDFGAHLVSLLVPNRDGIAEDVVLGFDDAEGYRTGNGVVINCGKNRCIDCQRCYKANKTPIYISEILK